MVIVIGDFNTKRKVVFSDERLLLMINPLSNFENGKQELNFETRYKMIKVTIKLYFWLAV